MWGSSITQSLVFTTTLKCLGIFLDRHFYKEGIHSDSILPDVFIIIKLICLILPYKQALGATDLPRDILDAHLLIRLLIVIIPLAVGELNPRKLGARVKAVGQPLTLGCELGKLQTAAVKLDDFVLLWWLCLLIGCGRRLDGGS